MSIRHATEGDLKQIFELLLATYRPYQWVMPGVAYTAYVTGLLDLGISAPAVAS